jgi:hypothetical protein
MESKPAPLRAAVPGVLQACWRSVAGPLLAAEAMSSSKVGTKQF